MKKSLSLLLSGAMVMGSFASVAFAADTTTTAPTATAAPTAPTTPPTTQQMYDDLAAKGIFQGVNANGDAGLDLKMTRAQFARTAALVKGLEGIGNPDTLVVTSAPFKDVAIGKWFTEEVAAVKAAGIMVGNANGTFNPNGNITVQELAVVTAQMLGLKAVDGSTVTGAASWAAGYIKALADNGVTFPTNYKETATRAQLVGVAYQAYAAVQAAKLQPVSAKVIDANNVEVTFSDKTVEKVVLKDALVANKETEITVTHNGKDYKYKITWVVTDATKVQSVTATNLKEIDVAFDGNVDPVTAGDKANYTLATGTVDSVEVLDSKTVRLVVATKLANQTANKLTVKNVKAGSKVISVTDFAFTPIDNTLPTVVEVKNLGTKAVKVVFSEPVETAISGNFKIDGKTFYGSPTQGTREVILTPYDASTLTVGEHTLTVAGVVDYFGLKSLSSDSKFTVVEDKTAPTVSKVDATLEKVTVTFSEEVDPATVLSSNVYWKSGDIKKTATNVKKLAADKYEFNFTANALPAWETILFVEGVKDYSGNTISDTQVKVTATVDQVRPEVTEVKSSTATPNFVTVKFSKAVDAADKQYYTIKNSDGTVQPIKYVTRASGDYSDALFTIELYGPLSGTNTINITGVQDKTALKNTMFPFNSTISLGDVTGPKFSGIAVNSTSRTINLTFNEKMDPATLGDARNYLIYHSGSLQSLPEGTQIDPVQNGTGVRIILPEYIGSMRVTFPVAGSAATVTQIQVMGVKDVAGNVLQSFFSLQNLNEVNAALDTYDAATYGSTYTAVLTDKNTIKVRFNQPIGIAGANDFAVSSRNVSYVDVNGTEVVVHLGDSVTSTTIAPTALTVKVGNAIKTTAGNSVNNGTANIYDAVAPEVYLGSNTHLTVSGANTIQLPFSEILLTGGSVDGFYKNDLVVTRLSDNKEITVDKLTTTVTGGSNVLNITVADGAVGSREYSVKVKANANFIADLKGNRALESSVYETDIGYVGAPAAPVVNTVGDSTTTVTGTAEAGSTVTVKKGGTTLGSAVAASNGAFSVTIVAQTAGDTLTVDATNATNHQTGTATTVIVVDNTAPAQPTLISTTKKAAAAVTITAPAAGNAAWLAPAGTTTFTAGATKTTSTTVSIAAPATEGTYNLYIVDAAGNVSAASTGTVVVDNTAPLVTSAVFTDATHLTVTFNEAVNAIATDFTDGKTSKPGTFTVTSATGTGTSVIVLVIAPVTAGDIAAGLTGSVDVAATVTDIAGNAIAPLNDQAVTGF